jgi:hypothetical protein
LKSVRQILRSERGDLLIESVVGTVIVALTLIPVAGILIGASNASASAKVTTSRTIFLSSVLADETPMISAYSTAPTTTNRSIDGAQVPVTLWREDPNSGTAILHAALPGYSTRSTAVCTNPASLDGCLTDSVAVALDTAGIALTKIPFTAGSGDALGTADIGAGVQEIRYVFKVTAAAADTKLHLATHPGTAAADIAIPKDQTGYYFGSLQVDPGTAVEFTAPAGATVDPDSIVLYESPKP